MAAISIPEARILLAGDVIAPEDVEAVFAAAPSVAGEIPFTREALEAALRNGEMLVYRSASLRGDIKLSLAHMIATLPDGFDPKFLTKMGYQLKDEWGIALEPSTATEVCAPGWALVRKDVLDESLNLSFEAQDTCLAEYGGRVDVTYRRRSAVEAVYDTLLYWKTHKTRLLPGSWDWTSSRTLDGGYLNVGGFGEAGLQVLSYSKAVRHGALGVCPARP